MRIINATTTGSNNSTPTFNLAGRDAYYQAFGVGEWYGKDIAAIAASKDHDTYVIGWAAGYIRGARPDIEEQITRFIEEDTI